MKGTKIFWGQVLLVGGVVLAFIWTATEWTAWRLAFQPEFGGAFVMSCKKRPFRRWADSLTV